MKPAAAGTQEEGSDARRNSYSRLAILALTSFGVVSLLCSYLKPEHLFEIDWDTAVFFHDSLSDHAVWIANPVGTHILYGWFVFAVQSVATGPDELLTALRWAFFGIAAASVATYGLYVRELFRGQFEQLLALGFFVTVPLFQFLVRTMEDELLSMVFIGLFFCGIVRYWNSGSLVAYVWAIVSCTFGYFFGLAHLPYLGVAVCAPFVRSLRSPPLCYRALGLGALALVLTPVALVSLLGFFAEQSVVAALLGSIFTDYPDAPGKVFFRTVQLSWSEPLIGCRYLDCLSDVAPRLQLLDYSAPLGRLAPVSALLGLAALAVPAYLALRRRWFELAVAGLALVLAGVFLIQLYVLADPAVYERMCFLVFLLPLLLAQLQGGRFARFIIPLVFAVLIAFGIHYHVRSLRVESPVETWREFHRKTQAEKYFYSSDDFLPTVYGLYFTLWLAGMDAHVVSRVAIPEGVATMKPAIPETKENLQALCSRWQAEPSRIYLSRKLRQRFVDREIPCGRLSP